MNIERINAIKELLKLATRKHYYCEDCWYSCPMAPDGSCDDSKGSGCTCGAEKNNMRVEELKIILLGRDIITQEG